MSIFLYCFIYTLLLPQRAHCPMQTFVNNSSVMFGPHTVGLLGNYSLFFLCSKLSLSFFLCILLPLYYVLCFTSSSFLLPIPRFFILLFPYSLPLFSLPYSFLPFLFFLVHVPPFAFSIFLLISVSSILSLSFFFLLLFLSHFLYFLAAVFETCKYSRSPIIRNNWDDEPSGEFNFSLKIGYIGTLMFGCYYLQYVPASELFDHACFEVLETIYT